MKSITFAFVTCLIGCGGAQPGALTSVVAPIPMPTPDVGVEPTPDPGVDPTTTRTYTNTYGNNFCDSENSGLDCWGDVTFSETPVVKLWVAESMVCVSHSWDPSNLFTRTVTCYAHNVGPISMDPHNISGLHNSSTQTFDNVTLNSQGQLCFKISEWHSGSISSITTTCGLTPTNDGGIQP